MFQHNESYVAVKCRPRYGKESVDQRKANKACREMKSSERERVRLSAFDLARLTSRLEMVAKS